MIAILNSNGNTIELHSENDQERNYIKELYAQNGSVLNLNINSFIKDGKLVIQPKTIMDQVVQLGSDVTTKAKKIGSGFMSTINEVIESSKKNF